MLNALIFRGCIDVRSNRVRPVSAATRHIVPAAHGILFRRAVARRPAGCAVGEKNLPGARGRNCLRAGFA
jgi:hypothetical protein